MNLNEVIEQVVNKVKADPSLIKKFTENPLETVKSLVKLDLDEKDLTKVVDAVKSNALNNSDLKDALGKIGDLLK